MYPTFEDRVAEAAQRTRDEERYDDDGYMGDRVRVRLAELNEDDGYSADFVRLMGY